MREDAATQLIVQIDGDSISERRLQELAVRLRRELTALRPVSVDLQRAPGAPAGAMAVEAFTIGALAIAVLPAMLPALIEYLREWSLRNANRTITIKRSSGEEVIEISIPEHLPSERLNELVALLSDVVEAPASPEQTP